MKFAPTCAFSAVVACLLAQSHGVHGALRKQTEERKLSGHGHHGQYYPPPPPPGYPVKETEHPTERPTPRPTPRPTDRPTHHPTPTPSARPSPRPTPLPTEMPSPRPTTHPPTRRPTPFPTELEIHSPSPTRKPTPHPTTAPTPRPTPKPSKKPTPTPTRTPTTDEPTTLTPTISSEPSENPTGSEEPSENPTFSAEPSETPTVSLEPSEMPLQTVAETICDPQNAFLFGNFCTLIRRTGIAFFLNDFQPLDGTFDDFFDFVQGPLIGDDRRALVDDNERALSQDRNLQGIGTFFMTGYPQTEAPTKTPSDSPTSAPTRLQEIPGIPNLKADDFVAFFEQNFPDFIEENPFEVLKADDFIEEFLDETDAADRVFTVFAPTNGALLQLGDDFEDWIEEQIAADEMITVGLGFESFIVGRELKLGELVPGIQLVMANGEVTRTEKEMDKKFQLGLGNVLEDFFPEISTAYKNTDASNGIIQVINHVILPEIWDEAHFTPAPTESAAPSSEPSISTFPTLSPTDTVKPTTTFAPTITAMPTVTAAPTWHPTITYQPTTTYPPTVSEEPTN